MARHVYFICEPGNVIHSNESLVSRSVCNFPDYLFNIRLAVVHHGLSVKIATGNSSSSTAVSPVDAVKADFFPRIAVSPQSSCQA